MKVLTNRNSMVTVYIGDFENDNTNASFTAVKEAIMYQLDFMAFMYNRCNVVWDNWNHHFVISQCAYDLGMQEYKDHHENQNAIIHLDLKDI